MAGVAPGLDGLLAGAAACARAPAGRQASRAKLKEERIFKRSTGS
jgi:hypothetical protein